MYQEKTLFIACLTALLIGACSSSESENVNNSRGAEDTMPAVQSIYNSDFKIRCEPADHADKEAPPETNILIVSNKLSAPVLVATEPACVETRNQTAFNMPSPSQTAFTINGYYAGGGYYYYGQVKNDTLNIYRQWIDEPHPDNDSDPSKTAYKLFKNVVIKADGNVSVNTLKEKDNS